MQMIKVKFHKSDGAAVEVAGQQVDVLDVGEDFVLAECGLDQLKKETTAGFPDRLHLQVHNEDGFGTFFFHELLLSRADDSVSLQFRCHTPTKYWEGRFGLATFITAMQGQVRHLDDWNSADVEVEDDWKGITLERSLAKGSGLCSFDTRMARRNTARISHFQRRLRLPITVTTDFRPRQAT
jgi:hypothetical protein